MSVSVRNRYSRGSEWRRWDLHVHTPFSVLNNRFGTDFDSYAKALLERAVGEGIAAVGVTDYFTIEGYKALRELISDEKRLIKLVGEETAEASLEILLIPNIEFRSREVICTEDGDAKVNFHVIFSDEIPPNDIDDHFLRELKFTVESKPDTPDQRHSVTIQNLEDLGKRLKAEHEPFRDKSDRYVGMMNAVVSHEDVSKVFDRQLD